MHEKFPNKEWSAQQERNPSDFLTAMQDQSSRATETKHRLETAQNSISITSCHFPVLRRKKRESLALSTASFTDSKENMITNYRDSLLTRTAFLSSTTRMTNQREKSLSLYKLQHILESSFSNQVLWPRAWKLGPGCSSVGLLPTYQAWGSGIEL